MRQLEVTGREVEPLESEQVEKEDEETSGTTIPVPQVFEDALYRRAKMLKHDDGQLPMADDKW